MPPMPKNILVPCVKWEGATPHISYNSIGNPSTSTPMRVDYPGIKDANSIGSGWVRVTDQNPGSGQDISCLLVSVYRLTSGSSAYAWTNTNGWQKSVGSRPNVQSLSFSAVG